MSEINAWMNRSEAIARQRDYAIREAAAMQERFAEQTRRQIEASNRLSAQRNALEEVCCAMLEFLRDHDFARSADMFADQYEAARLKGAKDGGFGNESEAQPQADSG